MLILLNTAEEYAETIIGKSIFDRKIEILGISSSQNEKININQKLINIETIIIDGNIVSNYNIEKNNTSFIVSGIVGEFKIVAISGNNQDLNPMIQSAMLKHISYLYEFRNQNIDEKIQDINNVYSKFKKIKI